MGREFWTTRSNPAISAPAAGRAGIDQLAVGTKRVLGATVGPVSAADRSGHVDSGVKAERLLRPPYVSLTIGIVTLVLLVAFEAMAVTAAMPIAVRELHGLSLYAWSFSGFITASMFATVLAGELCDRVGPTRPFAGGVGIFTAGLIVAGSAPNMLIFLSGRMLQGLGGGAVIVAQYVLIARAFPTHLRPRVFAVISSAWVLPSIVGPVVAGVVTEHASWRLVFLGLVPFAVVPVALVVPRLRRLASVPPPERRPGRKRRALATALGIGFLQYAGQTLGWRSVPFLVVGVVLLVVGLPRLLPAGTLRFRRGLPSVVGLRGLFAGAFFGAQAFLTLMLIEHRELPTTLAGLALTVGAIGWSAGSWWQGRARLRTSRAVLISWGAGFLTIGLTLVLLGAIPVVPVVVVGLGTIFAGLGMGLSLASLSVLLLEYSHEQEQGSNGAAAQLADGIGNAALVGAAGVIFVSLRDWVDATMVFIAIDALMIAVAVASFVLAHRVGTKPPPLPEPRARGHVTSASRGRQATNVQRR